GDDRELGGGGRGAGSGIGNCRVGATELSPVPVGNREGACRETVVTRQCVVVLLANAAGVGDRSGGGFEERDKRPKVRNESGRERTAKGRIGGRDGGEPGEQAQDTVN